MKLFGKIILAAIFLLTVSACTPPEPTMFGVPQSQWNNLSRSQQKQVIRGYNQRKQIETQNAPMQNLIDTAGSIVQTENLMR